MSRRSKTLEKYPQVAPLVVHALFDRDPTRGAYGEWMVRRVMKGEHHHAVLEAVKLFHRCKKRMPPEGRDLYRYEDTHALRNAVMEVGEISKRARRRQHRGYTLVHEYPAVSFYRVDSYTGMQALGRGTRWCVTNEGDYSNYKKRLIVVAVSRLRDSGDAYSRFALLSEKPVRLDPDQFFPWEKLRTMARDGYRFSWGVWDAKDRHPYHYRRHDEQPLTEILDVLAGRRGAAEAAMVAAAGGLERVNEMKVLLSSMQGRFGTHGAISVAERASKHRLFNPLSMLDHPDVRSLSACEAVWKLARKSHREALDDRALETLAGRPAINLPELFDLYVGQKWFKGHATLVGRLLDNGRLTQKTKERVLAYVRTQVFRLPSVE